MKIHEVIDKVEEYGMTKGNAGMRSQQSAYTNSVKRSNNKAMDQNREMMIKQNQQNRRANRLGRKIATGMPTRLLNPQQAQAPTGEA